MPQVRKSNVALPTTHSSTVRGYGDWDRILTPEEPEIAAAFCRQMATPSDWLYCTHWLAGNWTWLNCVPSQASVNRPLRSTLPACAEAGSSPPDAKRRPCRDACCQSSTVYVRP